MIKLITGRAEKAREISEFIKISIESISIDLPEIQSLDIERIGIEKAKSAFEKIGKPLIIDDTGLYINILNGFPGPLVKWFIDSIGLEGVLRHINFNGNRNAIAKTCITYMDSDVIYTFTGSVRGDISLTPEGGGFGFDPIFIPFGTTKTLGQMDIEEKAIFSMRSKAVLKFKNWYEKRKGN